MKVNFYTVPNIEKEVNAYSRMNEGSPFTTVKLIAKRSAQNSNKKNVDELGN
jgi:hypothetical protein